MTNSIPYIELGKSGDSSHVLWMMPDPKKEPVYVRDKFKQLNEDFRSQFNRTLSRLFLTTHLLKKDCVPITVKWLWLILMRV